MTLGPLGFLADFRVLMAIGLVVSHGYAFRQGRAFQANADKGAIVALNKRLEALSFEQAKTEISESDRIREAVGAALKSIPAGDLACLMPPETAKKIAEIVQ